MTAHPPPSAEFKKPMTKTVAIYVGIAIFYIVMFVVFFTLGFKDT